MYPCSYPIDVQIAAEMREAGVPPTFGHYYEAQRAAAFAGDTAMALGLLEEYRAATGKEVRDRGSIELDGVILCCR